METAPARSIMLHPALDTVAIVLEDVPNGRTVAGVTAREHIPRFHKIAVRDHAENEPVMKYGHTIGYTTKTVLAGEWVHEHNLHMGRLADAAPTSMAAMDSERSPDPPSSPPPIGDRSFLGFRAEDGRVGTRNYILIGSTVDCSARTVELAVEELNGRIDDLSRRFPNVDGIVGLTHDSGCGLVASSPAHRRQNTTIRNLLDHPNVGGRVLVQLGCEKGQASLVFGKDRLHGIESMSPLEPNGVPLLTMQDSGGSRSSVQRIVEYVERVLLPSVDSRRRELVPASELIMATQCGGSDATSGFTSNAAIGHASDLVVRCGGTSFIAETTETFGAERTLAGRAESIDIANSYLAHVAWYREYLNRAGATAQANLAHGNKTGGLSTIAEKSLGSIAKGGTTALRWVVDYGERITRRGFGFMNSPAFDPASATGQTAGGAHVGVFSTGAGSCFGGILIPWIKIVSNTDTFERLADMEVNAGRIADGTASVEDVGRHVFERVLAAASGARTYSEKLGYSVVNIWNSGVVT